MGGRNANEIEAAARHTGHRKPSSCPTPAEERRAAGARALTPAEVERVIEVAKNNHRDATLILVAYRHGLRAAEVCRQEMLSLTQIKGPASPGLP